jgi:mannose-1-phosphate guanylyltransferase/mannose-6-phosphate isomerase
VLVLAADHFIPDAEAFVTAVTAGTWDAELGFLVTFGVNPGLETAARYVAEGYLWNSGNFLFQAETFLDEVDKLAPEVHTAVAAAIRDAVPDLDFLRLGGPAYARSPAISVDYAVMEHTGRATVLPVSYQWSDVGSWEAFRPSARPTPTAMRSRETAWWSGATATSSIPGAG